MSSVRDELNDEIICSFSEHTGIHVRKLED